MKKLIRWILLVCISLSPAILHARKKNYQTGQAITHEVPGSRFGDCLLSYIHAKWYAYTYNLPLLYQPFHYSHELCLSQRNAPYKENRRSYRRRVFLEDLHLERYEGVKSIIFTIPYFPESSYERKHGLDYTGHPWRYIDIGWSDPGFRKEVFKDIKPIKNIPKMNLPKDRICVALHLRKGGGFDTEKDKRHFAMKFLSDKYYIDQLAYIYTLLHERPLYVYLFTDDANPIALAKTYAKHFVGKDIVIDCRKTQNSENLNVLYDFFAMMQFDCLVHSHSTFSQIPSLLVDYLVSICPIDFVKREGTYFYENSQVRINKNHPKYIP